MHKVKLGADTYLYPMSLVIVGAIVENHANFATVAYCSIVQHIPPMIAISLEKSHYTNQGIKANRTFSVNIPSKDMSEITEYIGKKSGREVDKSKLFEVFEGELKTAPMIREAPLNMECDLIKIFDLSPTNEIFVGQIVQVYINNGCLTNGAPDIKKIRPIIF